MQAIGKKDHTRLCAKSLVPDRERNPSPRWAGSDGGRVHRGHCTAEDHHSPRNYFWNCFRFRE